MEEVCGQSIPQNGVGGKRACRVKVGSPKEGQAHRHKEAACILGVGIVRGVSPLPHSEAFGKGKGEEG